jgi:hypothetical protein
MEKRQTLGQSINGRVVQTLALQHQGKQGLLVELAHLHGRLNHRTRAMESGLIRRAMDVTHTEVNVRGQTAIEPDFLNAVLAALGGGAEINETELHRLAQFVGESTGQ